MTDRLACEGCGASDRDVSRSEELEVTLCGPCWDARTAKVSAGAVLCGIEDFIARFVVLPGEAEATAVALWIAHTHAIEGAHATPYLLVLSPEKRSGKTRGQEVAELLVARPWRVTGASEAAIFRKIGQDRPTLLLDEIDAIFGSFAERTEPIRAILNAGNRPGATVARCVGEKGDQVKDFPVFGAKCLAGIDKGERIPDTIRDRSLTIAMRRKTNAEPVERLRWRDALGEAGPLRAELANWGEGAVEALLEAEPAVPPELDDRAAEAWEPLLAIADMAGGEWPRRARAAAVYLSADEDREEVSLGALLLGAIREAFGDEDRITTATLLERVNADEELPFGGWRDGTGLDPRRLAKLLRPYKVKPKKIRFGDELARGYLREDLEDSWRRWLPDLPTEAEQAEQAEHGTEAVTETPLRQADVPDVPDVPDISGGVPESGTRSGNGASPPCTCERPVPVQRGSEPWTCERCGGPCDGFEISDDPELQARAERLLGEEGE